MCSQNDDSSANSQFTSQRKKVCDQCPFSRSTPKSYLDTRGNNGGRFVAQANCNAILPCHREDPDNNAVVGQCQQCAGAAIFRANIGVADQLSPRLGKLEADTETVFATNAELLAHHTGGSLEDAEWFLEQNPIDKLVAHEKFMAAMQNKFSLVERED